jgi:head-tail adaptor
MIPAMRRSNLVSFQRLVKTASAEGFNDTEQWVEICQAWVSITPNRGQESFTADERVQIVSHTVRGDYTEISGISEDMAMLLHPSGHYSPVPDGTRWFDVLAVMNDEDLHADTMIKVQEKPRGYGV